MVYLCSLPFLCGRGFGGGRGVVGWFCSCYSFVWLVGGIIVYSLVKRGGGNRNINLFIS